MTDKIKVLVVDNISLNIDLFDEYKLFSIRNNTFLNQSIVTYNPHVIITFGDIEDYEILGNMPLSVRRKWVHIEDKETDTDSIKIVINQCFSGLIKDDRDFDQPLISVITPTYNTSDIFWPYRSLKSQSYQNWEWIIYDDGSSDLVKDTIREVAALDPRVKVFFAEHSGSIGEVKKNAFSMANGEILVELDHDDQLTSWCLDSIKFAFDTYPDSGFVYTDCAEVVGDDHLNATYPDGWGFGYGSYRHGEYYERDYMVTNYPSINSKTIRHIVGVPNHARAWTSKFYHSIGGHNKNLHVADDYELLVRTFLNTKMTHVKHFGYIQYHHGNNTQTIRNAEIQRLVNLIWLAYEDDIHNRFIELGVDDFIWNDGMLMWEMENPENTPIANYEIY